MKKILIILLLSSCTGDNQQAMIKWVEIHPKPIICKYGGENGLGYHQYTLIDANGSIYITGFINTSLPDTIKSIRIEKIKP